MNSSYQAIWMASSFGSLDVFGSSSNPSSPRTRSRRSVKRSVSGSVPGNFSASAIPMSSASVHFIASSHRLLRAALLRLAELNAAAFLDVIARVHRQLADHVAADHRLTPQPRLGRQTPRRVEAVRFIVLHLAQELFAL